MKRLFLILTLVAVCGSLSAQALKPKAPERRLWINDSFPLYGDVESVTVTEFSSEPLSGEGYAPAINRFTFDANGNVIEEYYLLELEDYSYLYKYTYLPNGNIVGQMGDGNTVNIVSKYDALGNIIERELTLKRSTGGDIKQCAKFEYDTNGNLICEIKSTIGGATTQYDYAYNAKGQKVEQSWTENGELQSKDHYEYDDLGRCIQRIEYDASDDISEVEYYYYDLKGNCVERASYSSNGDLRSRYIDIYDWNGNLVERVLMQYRGNSTVMQSVMKCQITYRK